MLQQQLKHDAIPRGYVRIIKRGRGDQYGTRATDSEELGDVIFRFTEHKLQSRPPWEHISYQRLAMNQCLRRRDSASFGNASCTCPVYES